MIVGIDLGSRRTITIDHLRAACGRAQPGEPYVTMAQLAAYDTPVETLASVGLVRCAEGP